MRVAPRIPPAACGYDGRDASRGPVFRRARRTARRARGRAAREPPNRPRWSCCGSRARSTARRSPTSTTASRRPSATARSSCCSSTPRAPSARTALALAQRVADLDVPVLAWVGPTPATASGAGLLLMYASSLAGVAPGSQTGPLDPLDLLHPEELPAGLDDDDPGVARRARQGHGARAHRRAAAGGRRDRARHRLGGGHVGDRLPRGGRRRDRADPRRSGHARDPHRHERGGSRAGHGGAALRQPRADPAGRPRDLDALDGLLPARVRAGGAGLRDHPAGVRVRRVRGRRHARARRLRALGGAALDRRASCCCSAASAS